MKRWLAIGAVVGFALAVLAISVFGGPGDQPAPAPAAAATPDAGPVVVPAIATPMALPTAAERRLGAMGPALVVEEAPGRGSPAVMPQGDGGPQ